MTRLLLLIILVGLYGCGETSQAPTPVYISGEIVNPTDPYVILLKGEQPIDSARLDAQNRFELRIDSLESGLYNFFHRPEFQYIYLEQGDSIQVRLNTVAFDESLVFSGSGEGINNFLIDFFLESEGEENLIRERLIPMEPQAFSDKLDSLKERKLGQLAELQSEFPITKGAYHTAESSILYTNYYYKEKYPFWHRKLTGDATGVHELPEDYYAYRSEVSYDDPSLTFLKPYHDFMIFHIGNLAYMGCKKACEIKDEEVGNQLHFNQHQLQLIDSLVTGDELRDNLFRTVAFDYLLKYDSQENLDQFMADFNKCSENNRHFHEIEALSEAIRNLSADEEIPNLMVEDASGSSLSLKDISASKKPIVFYFWSGPQQHHLSNITQRVRSLHEKYKDYRFVGICLRTDKARWKSMISTYGLNPDDQYWAEDFDNFSHTLVVYHPYKSILVKDGKIVDGFANLNTSF